MFIEVIEAWNILDVSLMPWGFKGSSLRGVVSNHDEQ